MLINFVISVEKLLHKNLIRKMYPLHEPESLKRLGHDWLISKQPTSLARQLPLSMFFFFFCFSDLDVERFTNFHV